MTTNPNPVFFSAIDHGLQTTKERDQLHWLSSKPQAGDRVPMGGDRLWDVVALETYTGDVGDLTIVHAHPVGVVIPDRAEWYVTRLKARKPLASTTLYVKPDGALHQTSSNFTGKLPEVRKLLTAFDVVSHRTGSQPWGIESYDTYSPASPDATFKAVYLAHVVSVDLSEVPGAIVLEPESIALINA